ncbi:MAG: hypothetical protein AAF564_03675 [Bacteroidota bacterium]
MRFFKTYRLLPVLLALLVLILPACKSELTSQTEAVQSYYAGLNAGDFQQVTALMADTFVVIEGDFTRKQSRADHYTMFQWDSVFASTYDIKNLEQVDAGIRVRVASSSVRYAYLKNNPLACEMTFSFQDRKINKLLVGECPEADWGLWEARRDSMVAWIDSNHTHLSGFIYDLTKEGAEQYLEAMSLYESRIE